jgi:hypothetical protein
MKHWVDAMMDDVKWTPCEQQTIVADALGLPYTTHTGVLRIGSMKLNVVQLNTGQRLITQESIENAFGV